MLADIIKYALHALRPTMARFLLEAGADVNAYEIDLIGLLR